MRDKGTGLGHRFVLYLILLRPQVYRQSMDVTCASPVYGQLWSDTFSNSIETLHPGAFAM